MEFYYGKALLNRLTQYYEQRLSLAITKQFDVEGAQYHWLYLELAHRVSTLRRVQELLSVLPEFMCRKSADEVFAMVIGHTTAWFSDAALGELPRDNAGNCTYYQDSNPYWVDYQAAMDQFSITYDYTRLATFYVDLTEYFVMAIRLYFYIREHQFKPIDRKQYTELVGVRASLPVTA